MPTDSQIIPASSLQKSVTIFLYVISHHPLYSRLYFDSIAFAVPHGLRQRSTSHLRHSIITSSIASLSVFLLFNTIWSIFTYLVCPIRSDISLLASEYIYLSTFKPMAWIEHATFQFPGVTKNTTHNWPHGISRTPPWYHRLRFCHVYFSLLQAGRTEPTGASPAIVSIEFVINEFHCTPLKPMTRAVNTPIYKFIKLAWLWI